MSADRPGEPSSEPFEGVPPEAHPETSATADSSAGHHGRSARPARETVLWASDLPPPPLHCRDCPLWYGEEDRGWGPCSIKHQRGDMRFITFGAHQCDEGYLPPVVLRGTKAARLSGVRSTSSASAVGYSSTSKQGKGKERARRRRSSGSTSSRPRASSAK